MKPSVMQILNIGKEMGFDDLDQAYFDYMRHYDCFFLLDKYEEQYKELFEEFDRYGLLDRVDGNIFLKQVTISEAIEIVEKYNESKN